MLHLSAPILFAHKIEFADMGILKKGKGWKKIKR
jgi:hypothetical protein